MALLLILMTNEANRNCSMITEVSLSHNQNIWGVREVSVCPRKRVGSYAKERKFYIEGLVVCLHVNIISQNDALKWKRTRKAGYNILQKYFEMDHLAVKSKAHRGQIWSENWNFGKYMCFKFSFGLESIGQSVETLNFYFSGCMGAQNTWDSVKNQSDVGPNERIPHKARNLDPRYTGLLEMNPLCKREKQGNVLSWLWSCMMGSNFLDN